MKKLDYRNKVDIKILADSIQLTEQSYKPYLCAMLVDNKLMIVRPWYNRIAFNIVKLVRGSTYPLWVLLMLKNPEVINKFIEDTINHILFGKDLTTKDAAGGFNQDEIDIISKYIN